MSKIYRYYLILRGLVGAIIYVLRHFKKREAYLLDCCSSTLGSEHLPPKIRKRLRQYIPVFLVIEYFYATLTDITLNSTQRKCATLLCGITPMFDDMIDDYGYTTASIMPLVRKETLPIEPESKCAIAFFQAGDFQWNPYWDHTLAIQTASIHQKTATLSKPELISLTREKGGMSVVFGWHIITQEYGGDPIKQAAWELGAYAQLINDIFDIGKDRDEGIATLATRCKDFEELSILLGQFYAQLQDALTTIPVRAHSKKQLMALLSLLHALGWVALHHLQDLQQKQGGAFKINEYATQQLVCDMATWKNRFRWGWKVLNL